MLLCINFICPVLRVSGFEVTLDVNISKCCELVIFEAVGNDFCSSWDVLWTNYVSGDLNAESSDSSSGTSDKDIWS